MYIYQIFIDCFAGGAHVFPYEPLDLLGVAGTNTSGCDCDRGAGGAERGGCETGVGANAGHETRR